MTSRAGTSSPAGWSSAKAARPSGVAGGHEGDVGGVAVEHDRFVPSQVPLAAGRWRSWPTDGERIACPALLDRDGAAAAPPARPAQQIVGARADGGQRWPQIADEKNGPGSGSRPISSWSTTASTRPRPVPPRSSGTSSAGPAQLEPSSPTTRR